MTILHLNLKGDPRAGWYNHPATKMWRGYEYALCVYILVFIQVTLEFGDRDNSRWELKKLLRTIPQGDYPHWFGDEDFHRSHRSNLIRKDPIYYRDKLGWTEPDYLPYIWPEGRNGS